MARSRFYKKFIRRKSETLYKVFGSATLNNYEFGYQKPNNKQSKHDVIYDDPIMDNGFTSYDFFDERFSGRI